MVEPTHELCRQLRLWLTRILFTKQRLAMQVGKLDHIIVDDRQPPDAGTGKRWNDRTSDPSRANHRDGRGLELALSDAPHLRQDDVPRIALEFVVGEGH